VRMPNIRSVCKKYKNLSLTELKKLLDSPVHEHRMVALVTMCEQFKKADIHGKEQLYKFYMDGLKRGKVNNWDLVDVTCPHVVGEYLKDKPRDILYRLANSKSLWDRRVSIIATFAFIKIGESDDSIKIAEILLNDKEDLIHKAVGWTLREVGKRVDEKLLCEFLESNAHKMPRTMLRYAIERLDFDKRRDYLSIKQDLSVDL
jgi:3-methyladenine DNA glycosylase AlkD